MNRIHIIAEAGVNHNGDLDLAFQLVDAAVGAGADTVKFQTFRAENLVTKTAKKALYQQSTTDAVESQFLMLKRLELSRDAHFELQSYCATKGIEFLSTAFDHESLDFLVNELGLDTLKIPSGEITNGPLLLTYAQSGANLILSTGMATIGEIEEALALLSFGFVAKEKVVQKPTTTDFQEAYFSMEGQRLLKKKVTLLHCTTEYPAPEEEINLNAMQTMRNAFGLNVGYSDHSVGITVPIAAATLGATVIEKHFTLDCSLEGPDHQASLEPAELKEMVHAIRLVEAVLGDGRKIPMPSEIKNKAVARKSLVASADIACGDQFSESNLTIKRPGHGISPMKYWEFLEEKSKADYLKDELIS